MTSIREQRVLLPIDYFHNKFTYFVNHLYYDTLVRVFGITSLIFCIISFSIWIFIGFDESDGIPVLFLIFALISQIIGLGCGLIGYVDYNIKELGFEGNLILLNKIIKLKPSLINDDKWSKIALDINNYINEKNIHKRGYIFYDGNDCKLYFEDLIRRINKYKKNKKNKKLKEEETKHHNKFKKSISKGKYHSHNHNHSHSRCQNHKYYCDSSTQTDTSEKKYNNIGRNNFKKPNYINKNNQNSTNINIDFGSNNNGQNTDPLNLSSIKLENNFLKKKFKKAEKVYENECIKYWENKYN